MSREKNTLPPGPGWNTVKDMSRREILNMQMMRLAAQVHLSDCIDDPRELCEIGQEILMDLFSLSILERMSPRVH